MPRRAVFILTAAATFLALFFGVRYFQKPAQAEPTLCHLFNEAFSISDGKATVLTDAFVREGFPEDQVASIGMVEALEAAAGPYMDATLITVSHIHMDHFNAESLLERLKNDPA
ncbi:MAG TPA: hypothetical protein VD713_01270, partial [Sphingomonadales bacterium]|nr:hypothetical protein [Sphingomonadales bacterium]